MNKAGDMWILEGDNFFRRYFLATQDQFEIDNLNLALKQVTNFQRAIDGGAHYGSWTRYMAKVFKSVYSFEPHPQIFECLTKNTAHLPNVTLVESAIGEKPGHVRVVDGEDNSGCGFVQRIKSDNGPPITTIDSYGFDDVGFIKLDVEGYEYFAIQGALETIERCKPIIHLEDKGHSEQYGVKEGSAVEELERLGATLLTKYKRNLSEDYIFGWK